MLLDTVTFSFTPQASDVGTLVCNVHAYLYDGNTLIAQNSNIVVRINVVDALPNPCLNNLRFSAI